MSGRYLGNTSLAARADLDALWNAAGGAGILHLEAGTNGSGTDVIAIGTGALAVEVVPSSSYGALAIGSYALNRVTTGDNNLAIGNYALERNVVGLGNLALGNLALRFATGNYNIAVGYAALGALVVGVENTAIGLAALQGLTTGDDNTFVGSGVGTQKDHGSSNVAVGKLAQFAYYGGDNNVAVGVEALHGTIIPDQIVDGTFQAGGLPNWTLGAGWSPSVGAARKSVDGVGTLTTNPAQYIDYSTGVGFRIVYTLTNFTVGEVTVSFAGQSDAPRNAAGTYTWVVTPATYPAGPLTFTPTGGSANTSRFDVTSVAVSCTTRSDGAGNVAVGTGALYWNTDGVSNVAVGVGALRQHASGNDNTALGVEAMSTHGLGAKNTAIGRLALYSGNHGNRNVAVGYGAGFYETGDDKLFIDNATRASEADGRLKALIYGIFAAAVANQELNFNARVNVFGTSAAVAAGGVSVGGVTRTTIGANGGATALTALPLGYLDAYIAGVPVQIPYYNRGA